MGEEEGYHIQSPAAAAAAAAAAVAAQATGMGVGDGWSEQSIDLGNSLPLLLLLDPTHCTTCKQAWYGGAQFYNTNILSKLCALLASSSLLSLHYPHIRLDPSHWNYK
jgi:hypothetical protein